jgi:lipopolysaccharide export system protein LptA
MLKQYLRNSFFIIASVVLVAAMPATSGQEKDNQEPIVVTSRRMEAEKLGDKVTFTGDVVLKKEGMTVTSDTMVVYYDVPTKSIREVDAFGNVVVQKEGRVALSNKATYDIRDEKIVLTGDARIIENDNQIGGEKITLFLRDDRSVVEGGKVLFYQEKQGEGRKRR